jgi:hypothetical protein
MSPHRAQRRASWAMVAGVVAIAALIWSVWLVGDHAADSVRASEAKARAELAHRDESARAKQTALLRVGCGRSVARDFEAWETNRDLRRLALDAAHVREQSGELAIARRYRGTASRAEFRMMRIKLRIPEREDPATVSAFCRDLYPEPTPSGG